MSSDGGRGRRSARAVWGATPAGTTFGAGSEPGSPEFFDAVRERRSAHEMPWLPEAVGFDRFAGKDCLEVGCGAGYDALTLCEHGSKYVGLDIAPGNPERTSAHLEPHGHHPAVLAGDAEALPFPEGSFDAVFSNGVLHHTDRIDAAFAEIFRVLRPGGEFVVIVYHRDSIFHWLTLGFADHILRRGYREMSFEERLGRIEFTTSGELPVVRVYSRAGIRKILKAAGFRVRRIQVRKLVPEDLPNVRGLRAMRRRIPRRVLDWAGRFVGWYVVAHAEKPAAPAGPRAPALKTGADRPAHQGPEEAGSEPPAGAVVDRRRSKWLRMPRIDDGPLALFWARVAGTLASKVGIVILGLATAVLTARVLGPSGRGVFAVLLTIGAIGVQLGNLGLPAAMTYRVASGRSTVGELLGTSLVAGLGMGGALAGGFVLLALVAPAAAPLDSIALVALGAAWIPLGVLNVLFQNLLLGLHRVRLYNLIQLLNKAGAVALLFLLFLADQASVVSFYLASLGVLFAGTAYGLVVLMRESGMRLRLPRRATVADMARYGFKAYLATFFAYVVLHFDLLMVAGMLGEDAAGHYSIAARLGEMIYLVPVAVGSILFATTSAMREGRWTFTWRTLKLVAAVLAVGLTVAALVARPVVGLLFGEGFLPAVAPFLWLLPGLFALGMNTIVMNYFAAVGMPIVTVISPAIAAAGNIALNFKLLPVLGTVGAALASSIAYSMMLLTSIIYVALRRPS